MREIPSIDQLLLRPAVQALTAEYGRSSTVAALRAAADALRTQLTAGGMPPPDIHVALERAVAALLQSFLAPSLRPVINASGVILHTNLGRAPLAPSAIQRVAALAGYSNLEYDLDSGTRGRRDLHAEKLLCRLTGAAAAVVVNNNAAATLLTLAALAAGREVLISRGELVEIGGGFRVPEVMAQSGAILREVGTTNRTRPSDYAAAISDRTAAILRVHPSNFRIEGFTERPSLDALVGLSRQFGIPLVEDIGSGWLGTLSGPAVLRNEPAARSSLRTGATIVLFSGDKLLGGPQAGIIAGTEQAVATVRRHPLMRAVRVDKMTYAALEATLREHATDRAPMTVPVARMIAMTADEIAARADAIVGQLNGPLVCAVEDGVSTIGGGSAPAATIPTRLIALTHPALSAAELESRLRASDPPVIARVENDRLLVDLRTVPEEQEGALVRALHGINRQSCE